MAFDENVPVAANQITADLTAMNANWEFLISGDGTAGRVLRSSKLTVDDGSNANTLKCTFASTFNGDTIAETDNVAKGATTGDFTLDADGKTAKIEAAGLSGNVIGILAVWIQNNLSTTNLNINTAVSSNDIQWSVEDADVGTAIDQTTLVDTGAYRIIFTYLTDA